MAGPTFTWRGPALLAAKNGAVKDALGKLAGDIDSHLASELHVWTGEMRDMRFAEVDERGDNPEVVFGSDASHTVFHELFARNYTPHSQIRETGDIFSRQLPGYIVRAFAATVRGTR
jgi:hypothetical protein